MLDDGWRGMSTQMQVKNTPKGAESFGCLEWSVSTYFRSHIFAFLNLDHGNTTVKKNTVDRQFDMSRCMTKPTKWLVHLPKTQIILGIRPVWSVFAVRLMRLHLDSEDSEDWSDWADLSSLGACHFVHFAVLWLIFDRNFVPSSRNRNEHGS